MENKEKTPMIDPSTLINVEIDGLDMTDNRHCDAFLCYAEFSNGTPLTDDQLEWVTDECPDFIYLQAEESSH